MEISVTFDITKTLPDFEEKVVGKIDFHYRISEHYGEASATLVKIMNGDKRISEKEIQNYVAALQSEPWYGYVLEDAERAAIRKYWRK